MKTYMPCPDVAFSELLANVIVEENLGGRPVGSLLQHLHGNQDVFSAAFLVTTSLLNHPSTRCL